VGSSLSAGRASGAFVVNTSKHKNHYDIQQCMTDNFKRKNSLSLLIRKFMVQTNNCLDARKKLHISFYKEHLYKELEAKKH